MTAGTEIGVAAAVALPTVTALIYIAKALTDADRKRIEASDARQTQITTAFINNSESFVKFVEGVSTTLTALANKQDTHNEQLPRLLREQTQGITQGITDALKHHTDVVGEEHKKQWEVIEKHGEAIERHGCAIERLCGLIPKETNNKKGGKK